jgi:predicted nucleic acid-binding protein
MLAPSSALPTRKRGLTGFATCLSTPLKVRSNLLSAVNWGEIVGALYKRAGALPASASTNIGGLVANLAALPLTIVAADKELAEAAAIFKHNFKLPFVDAFAGSLAFHQNATLVTADYDFKNVPSGTIKIEFLPTK